MRRPTTSSALAFAALLAAPPGALALPAGYALELVHAGLASPVCLRFAPDGRLFYLERESGRVMVFEHPRDPTPRVWATVPVNSTSERGLLGMAFHPDFPESAWVYLHVTSASPLVNRVVRLRDRLGFGVGAPQVILEGLPAYGPFHHGGRLEFGPEGMLYVTTGDQTDRQYAQVADDTRGKILRVTPLGLPAPGNPWGAGNPVFALGVRNPFGLAFDPLTGDAWFTENGPECDDELNLLAAGANYGWGPGDECGMQPAGTRAPLAGFTPTIAPTGCCVYRGVDPAFQGNLFFGSFNEGALARVVFADGNPGRVASLERDFAAPGEPVLDVTVGHDGLLWLSTVQSIHRVTPAGWTGVEPGAGPGFAARPNPAAGAVRFHVPGAAAALRLELVDVAGRRVREWAAPAAGPLEWDGADARGEPVPPGVYFARLVTPAGIAVRRLVRLAP